VYHLQFSLQAVSPETFGYTLVYRQTSLEFGFQAFFVHELPSSFEDHFYYYFTDLRYFHVSNMFITYVIPYFLRCDRSKVKVKGKIVRASFY
jgi:hypothetical protein